MNASPPPPPPPPMKPIPAWLPGTGAALLRAMAATWRVRTRIPPELDPRRRDRSQRFIYVLWHGMILMACHTYRGLGISIGSSEHRDGEIGARIARRFDFKPIRGSSTRNGANLLRGMMEFARRDTGDIALTPDGPKGPYHQTKPGALFLAGALGWPVVPIAFTARPRRHLKSWDRFIVPAPFAKVGIATGEPLTVPRRASEEELARLCGEVDRRMAATELLAEELVA